MQKVDLYKLNDDGSSTVVATFKLEGGVVIGEGEDKYVNITLENGINDYTNDSEEKLFAKDGLKFLEQLQNNFKSGYMQATEILSE